MQPENSQEGMNTDTPVVPSIETPEVTPEAPAEAVATEQAATEAVAVHEVVDTPVAGEVAAVAETPANKTKVIAGALIVAALLVAAGAYWFYTNKMASTAMVGGVEYPAVVAVVNGEEVRVAEFQQSYDQAAAIAVQQGFDPATDPEVAAEVKNQAVTILVNTVLMMQKAIEGGFTATDEQVEAEVAKLESQFGGAEQLASVLAGAGLDDAAMRSDLRDQLIVDAYLKSTPEVQALVVTDEEVRSYYDTAAAQMEAAPAFEEVEAQVREQLLYEKQGAATNAVIERVRAESTIEVKI